MCVQTYELCARQRNCKRNALSVSLSRLCAVSLPLTQSFLTPPTRCMHVCVYTGTIMQALTRNPKDVSSNDTMLVQEYLARPFLIDNFKFDLRIYILVTSVDPLRVFMYEDGLVRLSTVEYKAPTEGNMDQLYMCV